MYNKQGQNLQYGEPMGQAHGQAFQYASPMGMQNTAHAGRMPPSHAYKPSHGASSEGARPHGRVEALEIDQEQGGGGGMEMHIQQLVHDADKAIRHAFIRKVRNSVSIHGSSKFDFESSLNMAFNRLWYLRCLCFFPGAGLRDTSRTTVVYVWNHSFVHVPLGSQIVYSIQPRVVLASLDSQHRISYSVGLLP